MAHNTGESNSGRPLVIAHRGASAVAPENTLESFNLAVSLGADGIELDVHLSSEGVPVVIHDSRVDRTTDGRGAVARLSLPELAKLDASARFRRRLSTSPRLRSRVRRTLGGVPNVPHDGLQSVPTLKEVLDAVHEVGLSRVYVELKGQRQNRLPLLMETILQIRKQGMEKLVTIISFDHDIIERCREVAPDLRTGILVPGPVNRIRRWPSIVRAATKARADEVALHYSLASRRSVANIHSKGFQVSVWTVNSRMAMRRLAAAGVDSIITNFVDRLRQVLQDGKESRIISRRSGRKRLRRASRNQ